MNNMLKGRQFILKMRPDLAEMEGRHVDVRLTIGFCDETGTPRCKDRFFFVTPRVDREVTTKGGRKQRRSSLHPVFARLNGTPKELKGVKTVRITIQAVELDDIYRVQCACRKSPPGMEPPPGNQTYCRTTNFDTAMRWNPKTRQQEQIPCLGFECPLRQEYRDEKDNRFRPAKTEFTLVGKIDMDDHPKLLASTMTQSDTNLTEFMSLIESIRAKWIAMCLTAGQAVPFNPYGISIDLTVFTSTSGTSAYPRISYTLAHDLEEEFALAIARQRTLPSLFAGERAPLLITDKIEEADAADVLLTDNTFDADTGEPTQPITQQTTPPAPVIPPATPQQPARKPWYIQAADDLTAALAEGADVSDILAYLEKQHSDSRKASYAIQAITPHVDQLIAAGHSAALIRMSIILPPAPFQQAPASASIPDAEIEDDNGFPPAPVKPHPAEGSPEWFATLEPDTQASELIALLGTFTKPDDLPEYHRSFVPLSAVTPDAVKKRKDVRAAFGQACMAMNYDPKAK